MWPPREPTGSSLHCKESKLSRKSTVCASFHGGGSRWAEAAQPAGFHLIIIWQGKSSRQREWARCRVEDFIQLSVFRMMKLSWVELGIAWSLRNVCGLSDVNIQSTFSEMMGHHQVLHEHEVASRRRPYYYYASSLMDDPRGGHKESSSLSLLFFSSK